MITIALLTAFELFIGAAPMLGHDHPHSAPSEHRDADTCCEEVRSSGVRLPSPVAGLAADLIERDAETTAIAASGGIVHWIAVRSHAEPHQLLYRRFETLTGWQGEVLIAEGGRYDVAGVAALDNGAVWIAWIEMDEFGSSDVFALKLVNSVAVGLPVNISSTVGQDRQLTVKTDGQNVWLVWVSDNGNADVFLSRIDTADVVLAPVNVSGIISNDWHPDLALTNDGTVHVVWDSYRADNYDVFYRSFHPTTGLGVRTAVATGPEFQAHASICADELGRLWVAWEEAQADWGKGHLGNNTDDWDSAVANTYWEENVLHTLRTAHLAVYDPVALTLSTPSVSLDDHITNYMVVTNGQDYPLHDAPRLFRHAGKTWIFFRYGPFNEWENRWDVFLTAIDDTTWYGTERLSDLGGFLYQSANIVADGNTLWQASGRVGNEVTGTVYAQSWPDTLLSPGTDVVWNVAASPSVPGNNIRVPASHEIEVDGTTFHARWGDLHRHTELSRDRWWLDGPVEEFYRYARDVAKLDFIAQTDHSFPFGYIARHYPWILLQSDLYKTPVFAPLYGYEWSATRIGGVSHHNIISVALHDFPGRVNTSVEELDSLSELFGQMIPGTSIAIPHTTAKGEKDLNDWAALKAAGLIHPDFYRVVEVYQGARRSYEYAGAPSPLGSSTAGVLEAGTIRTMLEQDARLGLIASSDHWSNFFSFAVVYAEETTRESIFSALTARRCYGATDRDIVLEFWVNDRPMGESISACGPHADIRMTISAPFVATEVAILKDGFEWAVTNPGTSDYTDAWLDKDSCGHVYYTRVVFEGGHMAWSSPIWMDCTPCLSDAECDDGNSCNGEETCGPSAICQAGPIDDCNENGIDDSCDITDGTSADDNSNGFPDECEPVLRTVCAPAGAANRLLVRLTEGEPNTSVTFLLDGSQPKTVPLDSSGRAKSKWVGVTSGPHVVTAELENGVVVSQDRVCP